MPGARLSRFGSLTRRKDHGVRSHRARGFPVPERPAIGITKSQIALCLNDFYRYNGPATATGKQESDDEELVTVHKEKVVVADEFRGSETYVEEAIFGRENQVGSGTITRVAVFLLRRQAGQGNKRGGSLHRRYRLG